MKILIVDDNDTNRKLLRALLEAEPHSVLDACDGKLALCVLNTESVDAVISDIMMPAMDGYTLCHEMPRTGKNGAAIFVHYTSTCNSLADERFSAAVGADAYLAKPAPISTIQIALEVAAAKKATRNSNIRKPICFEMSSVQTDSIQAARAR